MTSAEYSTWFDEYTSNPWGEQRSLIHAAYIAMMVLNVRIKKPVELKDVVSWMQASIHQMLNPLEVPETDPDEFFGKFGD